MTQKKSTTRLMYCNPYRIMILNKYNKLQELHCPFLVEVKYNISGLSKGQKVQVELVKVSHNSKIVYIIQNKCYYYYHFDIII